MTLAKDKKITFDDLREIIAPFEIDLISVYKMIMEDIDIILNEALKTGLTPGEIEKRIMELF